MAENSNADKAISKERIKSKKSREDILEIIVAIFFRRNGTCNSVGVMDRLTAWRKSGNKLHTK